MQIKTMRYCLPPVRMAIITTVQIINEGESVGKRETFYTVSRKINLCNHYGEYCGSSLKN